MGDRRNRYNRYQFGNQPPWGIADANDPLFVYVQNEEKMDKARKHLKKLVGGGRKRKGADTSSESGSDKPKLSNEAAKRLAKAIEVQNAQKASQNGNTSSSPNGGSSPASPHAGSPDANSPIDP